MSLCQCGCGESAPVAMKTGYGYRKGQPMRFIRGHFKRTVPLRPFREHTLERLIIELETGCLLWTGFITGAGYGIAGGRRGERGFVHRLMYEWFVGPIPDGLEIDHLCRVRRCAAPAHLEAVTHQENILRAAALITHCPRGHEYTEANTRWSPTRAGGRCRLCKTCQHAAQLALRESGYFVAWRARKIASKEPTP